MQHAGLQYGQGATGSHQVQSFTHQTETPAQPNGGSTTSSLRQFRKKENLEKPQSDQNTNPVSENLSHVARVAPHSHYPRTNDYYKYAPSQFAPDYIMPYKEPSPVKYSEIAEPPSMQHIEHINPNISKHKDNKEYLEMCNNITQQSHFKQPYTDHVNRQQPYPHEQNVHSQYLHKEPQVHHSYKVESQYLPKELQYHQQYNGIQKCNMPPQNRNKYSPPAGPNDFLSQLQRINPSMAKSIMNDHHMRESQHTYPAMDQNRMYSQSQRYYPSPIQGNPQGYSHNYSQHRSIPQPTYHPYPPSCSYKHPVDYGRPSHQLSNSLPRFQASNHHIDRGVNSHMDHNTNSHIERSMSPTNRRPYAENLSVPMNYTSVPQKISPNYGQYNHTPEYAQHYQHRRPPAPPQDYYQQPYNGSQYMPSHEIPPQLSENRSVTVSNNLKHYLENWAEEEGSAEIPTLENNKYPVYKENIRIRDDGHHEPLYVINSSDLPHYLENSTIVMESGLVRIIENTNPNEHPTIVENANNVVNLHIVDDGSPDCLLSGQHAQPELQQPGLQNESLKTPTYVTQPVHENIQSNPMQYPSDESSNRGPIIHHNMQNNISKLPENKSSVVVTNNIPQSENKDKADNPVTNSPDKICLPNSPILDDINKENIGEVSTIENSTLHIEDVVKSMEHNLKSPETDDAINEDKEEKTVISETNVKECEDEEKNKNCTENKSEPIQNNLLRETTEITNNIADSETKEIAVNGERRFSMPFIEDNALIDINKRNTMKIDDDNCQTEESSCNQSDSDTSYTSDEEYEENIKKSELDSMEQKVNEFIDTKNLTSENSNKILPVEDNLLGVENNKDAAEIKTICEEKIESERNDSNSELNNEIKNDTKQSFNLSTKVDFSKFKDHRENNQIQLIHHGHGAEENEDSEPQAINLSMNSKNNKENCKIIILNNTVLQKPTIEVDESCKTTDKSNSVNVIETNENITEPDQPSTADCSVLNTKEVSKDTQNINQSLNTNIVSNKEIPTNPPNNTNNNTTNNVLVKKTVLSATKRKQRIFSVDDIINKIGNKNSEERRSSLQVPTNFSVNSTGNNQTVQSIINEENDQRKTIKENDGEVFNDITCKEPEEGNFIQPKNSETIPKNSKENIKILNEVTAVNQTCSKYSSDRKEDNKSEDLLSKESYTPNNIKENIPSNKSEEKSKITDSVVIEDVVEIINLQKNSHTTSVIKKNITSDLKSDENCKINISNKSTLEKSANEEINETELKGSPNSSSLKVNSKDNVSEVQPIKVSSKNRSTILPSNEHSVSDIHIDDKKQTLKKESTEKFPDVQPTPVNSKNKTTILTSNQNSVSEIHVDDEKQILVIENPLVDTPEVKTALKDNEISSKSSEDVTNKTSEHTDNSESNEHSSSKILINNKRIVEENKKSLQPINNEKEIKMEKSDEIIKISIPINDKSTLKEIQVSQSLCIDNDKKSVTSNQDNISETSTNLTDKPEKHLVAEQSLTEETNNSSEIKESFEVTKETDTISAPAVDLLKLSNVSACVTIVKHIETDTVSAPAIDLLKIPNGSPCVTEVKNIEKVLDAVEEKTVTEILPEKLVQENKDTNFLFTEENQTETIAELRDKDNLSITTNDEGTINIGLKEKTEKPTDCNAIEVQNKEVHTEIVIENEKYCFSPNKTFVASVQDKPNLSIEDAPTENMEDTVCKMIESAKVHNEIDEPNLSIKDAPTENVEDTACNVIESAEIHNEINEPNLSIEDVPTDNVENTAHNVIESTEVHNEINEPNLSIQDAPTENVENTACNVIKSAEIHNEIDEPNLSIKDVPTENVEDTACNVIASEEVHIENDEPNLSIKDASTENVEDTACNMIEFAEVQQNVLIDDATIDNVAYNVVEPADEVRDEIAKNCFVSDSNSKSNENSEFQYRSAIRIEENNVLLEIAGELIEININSINGKKVISVLPFSNDTLINCLSDNLVDINDNYESEENCETFISAPEETELGENLEQKDCVIPTSNHESNLEINTENIFIDNINNQDDITINEEVIESSNNEDNIVKNELEDIPLENIEITTETSNNIDNKSENVLINNNENETKYIKTVEENSKKIEIKNIETFNDCEKPEDVEKNDKNLPEMKDEESSKVTSKCDDEEHPKEVVLNSTQNIKQRRKSETTKYVGVCTKAAKKLYVTDLNIPLKNATQTKQKRDSTETKLHQENKKEKHTKPISSEKKEHFKQKDNGIKNNKKQITNTKNKVTSQDKSIKPSVGKTKLKLIGTKVIENDEKNSKRNINLITDDKSVKRSKRISEKHTTDLEKINSKNALRRLMEVRKIRKEKKLEHSNSVENITIIEKNVQNFDKTPSTKSADNIKENENASKGPSQIKCNKETSDKNLLDSPSHKTPIATDKLSEAVIVDTEKPVHSNEIIEKPVEEILPAKLKIVKRVSFSADSPEVFYNNSYITDDIIIDNAKSIESTTEDKSKSIVNSILKSDNLRVYRNKNSAIGTTTFDKNYRRKLSLQEYMKKRQVSQEIEQNTSDETAVSSSTDVCLKKTNQKNTTQTIDNKSDHEETLMKSDSSDNLLDLSGVKQNITLKRKYSEISAWELSPKSAYQIESTTNQEDNCLILNDKTKKPKCIIDINELDARDCTLASSSLQTNQSNIDDILQTYKEKVDLKLSSLNLKIPIIKSQKVNSTVQKSINSVALSQRELSQSNMLMRRFLNHDKLSPEDIYKVRRIILYKRLIEMSQKSNEKSSNLIINQNYDLAPGKAIKNDREIKMHLKKIGQTQRKRKRFRNLYAADSSDEETESSDYSDKNKNLGDYSVYQKNSTGVPKLIIKRTQLQNDLQPVVRLERSNYLDLLAKKRKYY